MKTIKTIFAALIAIFMVNLAAASGAGNLKVNMKSTTDDFTTVEISSNVISHFEIDVLNAYGDRIYTMETDAPKNSFKKKYDFSKLENGTYWHLVNIDKESTVNKFKVENGKVEILEVRKSIEPFFKFEDDVLKMSYLNPQKEEVKVYVYDRSNALLTKASLGSDFSINKAINFSELRRGSYEVVLVNGMDIHEHYVTIK